MFYPAPRPADAFHFERIVYRKDGYTATVTINRPEKYNALDFQTLVEFGAAFQDASWDDAIAVVVLTGAGERAFSTGADLTEQIKFQERPHDYWKWFGAFQEAHDRLRNIGKPTIARLNGIVVGGGNEFHIACDFAVAAEHVTIRQVGTARGSVPAAGATQWLPLIVGERRAREIVFLCEEIPAQKALEWGLVNQVVPKGELDQAVAALARKLYEKLPESTRYAKQQLNFWRDFSWGVTVGHARDWLTMHVPSAETGEGIAAFQQRRPMDYAGLRAGLAEPQTKTCGNCGATGLPKESAYCLRCGQPLQDR
ncbi:MAG: enoyl-CoA hydratase/isomerase family protein [Chloroflexi bacterium]|nr:enoyl-CoA hydratase/isomerase family protein [Chloroflexota bacterium]